jgi:hypothetical protein
VEEMPKSGIVGLDYEVLYAPATKKPPRKRR